MSDEIKERLQASAEKCLKSYEAWRKDEKKADTREALQEAVHEIRKVASRLEIELAVSERDQMAQKPIPIPPHRDARGRHQNADDNKGNKSEGSEKPSKPKKPAPKKAAGEG